MGHVPSTFISWGPHKWVCLCPHAFGLSNYYIIIISLIAYNMWLKTQFSDLSIGDFKSPIDKSEMYIYMYS